MERGQVYTAPTELVMARLIKSIYHAGGDLGLAAGYAEGQREAWRDTPQLFMLLKTAVSAIQTGDATQLTAARAVYDAYLPLLRARTVLDRVPGWRKVDPNVSVLRFSGDATGAVVGEGAAIPASKFSLQRVTLGIKKVAAMVLAAREVMDQSGGLAQSSIPIELAGAIGSATDRAMFNVDVAGSVAATGTILQSTGTTLAAIDADLKLALSYFASGDAALDRVVALTSPAFAAYLGSLRGTGGANAFPAIGARGGSLLQIPVFVSNALAGVGSPGNSQLTFVDPAQVLVADPRAAEITTSTSASIQMDDASTQSSATPTATNLVSLFETNTVAIAGLRYVDWLLSSSSGCVSIVNIAV